MSRKLLNIKHHLSSGCCMWSGIEDVYATNTGQQLPDAFFFGLSSFGETIYTKTGDTNNPFLFRVGDGRTRSTYNNLKSVIGLDYQISEGRTLPYALKSIKSEIDQGNPVILGPLDMYHLPYLSMYHKFHIPIHYIVMVGYDEEKDAMLIYDCDRTELVELSTDELIKAWQIEKNAVGNKNGFIRFQLSHKQKDKYELTDICLRLKAERQLCRKPDFIGVNAFEKIAKEFPSWKNGFSQDKYRGILASLVEYFGMVPKLPNEIMGIPKGNDIPYQGNYDRLSRLLLQMGEEYDRQDWLQAGTLFCHCGNRIEEIKNHIAGYYCRQEDRLSEVSDLFWEIGKTAREAYEIIAKQKGDYHDI